MSTGKLPSTQLSMDDAEPWSQPDVDAVPGRRIGAARRPGTEKGKEAKPDTGSEKPDMKPLKCTQDEDVTEQVRKMVEDLSTGECCSSIDSSYESSSPDSDKNSLLLLSIDDEIKTYWEKMPPHLKAPFVDVVILYAGDDREGAVFFQRHLINDIKLQKGEEVKALLYDCPEFTSLAGSQFQHLDAAVERSTYVFVYLTKSFVKDKWCEISSESCLMKAIYDDEKRWCVVPVYTQKRYNCDFKIPMGLNSLKGINYYNDDEFYRNGVARLIGDKVHVKYDMAKRQKVEQKEWIEKYKREQAELIDKQIKRKLVEEEITRQLQEALQAEREKWQQSFLPHSLSDTSLPNLPSLHHSLSTHSLKEVQEQNPHVANYMNQMRMQALALQNPQLGQYLASGPQAGAPSLGDAALYGNAQHAVQRSPSQISTPSKDAAPPSIPQEIIDKIQGYPLEEQKKYIGFYVQQQQSQLQEQQSLQQQQQAVLNMPPMQGPPMFYLPPGSQYPPNMFPGQHYSVPGQFNSNPSLGNQLMNAPQLSMNLSNQGQPASACNHGSLSQVSMPVTQPSQPSQIPNFDNLSMNSYNPQSASVVQGNSNNNYSTVSSQESYSTTSGESRSGGQSMDGPRSSHRGNFPNPELFGSMAPFEESEGPSSLEADSGSFDAAKDSQSKASVDRKQRNRDEVHEDKQKQKNTEEVKGTQKTQSKGDKHIHYTINVYSAQAVQVGDGNVFQEVEEALPSSGDSGGESDDDPNDERRKTTPQDTCKPGETDIPYRQKGRPASETQPPVLSQTPSHTPQIDALPSTSPNTIISQPDLHNMNSKGPVKASSGDKPMKPIQMVTPQVQKPPTSRGNKQEETALKKVVPTSQTARKVVDDSTSRTADSDSDNNENCEDDDLENNHVQKLTKTTAEERPNESDNNSGPENRVAPSPRNITAVRPVQIATATPQIRGPNFTTNASELFYRQRPSPGAGQELEEVEFGDDPLSQATPPALVESAGFLPNGQNDTEADGEFDMLEHDDYEGGEFTESVNRSLENSGSSGPKKLFGSLMSRFSKVK